jgi:flagella basal body P-ring formation protein FlgA
MSCKAPPPLRRHQEIVGRCSQRPLKPESTVYRSPPLGRPWPPATPCFRRFKLMFQVVHLDVAKVDLRCFICCNDNIRMFQAYVQSVLVVFKRMFQVFSSVCCIYCYDCTHMF